MPLPLRLPQAMSPWQPGCSPSIQQAGLPDSRRPGGARLAGRPTSRSGARARRPDSARWQRLDRARPPVLVLRACLDWNLVAGRPPRLALRRRAPPRLRGRSGARAARGRARRGSLASGPPGGGSARSRGARRRTSRRRHSVHGGQAAPWPRHCRQRQSRSQSALRSRAPWGTSVRSSSWRRFSWRRRSPCPQPAGTAFPALPLWARSCSWPVFSRHRSAAQAVWSCCRWHSEPSACAPCYLLGALRDRRPPHGPPVQ